MMSAFGRLVDFLLSSLGLFGTMFLAALIATLIGWYGRGFFIYLSN
jgi:hypothetical protein